MPAQYTPSAEDEEMYSVKPPQDVSSESQTTDDEIAENENSALVPNKVLSGPDGKAPKPGAEIVLRVVKVYGDESEVVYAPKTGADNAPPSADEEIEAMDQTES